MKKKKLFLIIALVLSGLTSAFAQEKEFWFVAPDVSELHGGCDSLTFMVISNPGEDACTVEVTIDGGTPTTGSPYLIAAGGNVKIDWNQAVTRSHIENPRSSAGSVTNKSIHIKVTNGDGVLAYYQVDGSCSKDMYSLKGPYALGKLFYVPMMHDNKWPSSYRGTDGFDQIDIVAAKATTVTITPTVDCIGHTAGTPFTVNLAAGQTYKVMETLAVAASLTGPTLAGTKIESSVDDAIAVTVTEDCAASGGATDVIGDQIVPTTCVGTRYIVVKGYTFSAATDRLYFTAADGAATVNVTGDGGFSGSVTLSGSGATDVIDIGANGVTPQVIYVESTSPVYCYQVSGYGEELGSALVPSMFSITQQNLAFYNAPLPITNNAIFVVFRDTCGPYFTLNGASFPITPVDLPPGAPTEWKYAKVDISGPPLAGQMVTLANTESPFSLGYFNYGGGTSGYGYISGFGDWSLPYDTLWRCQDSGTRFRLMGGYALSYLWTLPDGSTKNTMSIMTRDTGMYTIDMDVDYKHIYDTVYVYEMELNPTIERKPNKPAKIGVPQQFTVDLHGSNGTGFKYYWTFEGGTPSTLTTTSPRATVVWNTMGQKHVTMRVVASAGSGLQKIECDKTIELDLMLHEKNLGYFVNEDQIDGNHDGSSWENAFQEVYQALDSASQGDCIWVAEGYYEPRADNQSFVMDYDSVEMYGGFGGWEANINERDYATHKTILAGRGINVVTFDGTANSAAAGGYTSGSCGVSRATRLDGFTVQGGRSLTDGAGIVFAGGASGTVANCVIRANVATNNGGGVYIGGAYNGCVAPGEDPLFYNDELSYNLAATGAGMYNAGSAFLSVNNTLSGNAATVSAAGLYNEGNADLRNTIIWGNLTNGALGADVVKGSGTPVYSWCNIAGWSTALGQDGTYNIDRDPMFLRKGYDESMTLRGDGNYSLVNTSPSVDRGHDPYVLDNIVNRISTVLLHPADAKYSTAINLDLGGLSRISSDVVDMGAYEFHPESTPLPSIVHEIVIGTYPNMTTEPPFGIHYVEAHGHFPMTLTPDEGYSLDNITITTGSDYQDNQGGMVVTHNPDGTVTVVFNAVSGPLDVKISGISPTANISIENGYAIYAKDGNLYVQVTQEGQLSIYSVTGQLIKQQTVASGTTTIPMPQGVYIVTLDNGSKQKVVVK